MFLILGNVTNGNLRNADFGQNWPSWSSGFIQQWRKWFLDYTYKQLSAFWGYLSNHQVVEPRYLDFCLLLVNTYWAITLWMHIESVFLFWNPNVIWNTCVLAGGGREEYRVVPYPWQLLFFLLLIKKKICNSLTSCKKWLKQRLFVLYQKYILLIKTLK